LSGNCCRATVESQVVDIRQLRYFIAIADAGSLTQAAHRLGIAQPALSQHVLALESEFGTKLFDRGARGVTLTAAGITLREYALVILRDIERAREAVGVSGNDIAGRVAIGLPTTVAIVLAQPLLKAILETYPQVAVHLVESHSGFLREWLTTGRLDLAVLFNIAEVEDHLDLMPLLVEDIHLISSAEGGAQEEEIALSEIRRLDLLMPSQPHGLRRLLDGAVFLASGQVAHVKAEIDALPTLKRMVQAGLGHTVLPLAAVQEELAARTLTARKIVAPVMERHAALVSSSRRPMTRTHQAIAKLIQEIARQLVEEGIWPGRLQATSVAEDLQYTKL
jgi:LysR family transcriptional regulator, nitrogen assimilation regulatory protein